MLRVEGSSAPSRRKRSKNKPNTNNSSPAKANVPATPTHPQIVIEGTKSSPAMTFVLDPVRHKYKPKKKKGTRKVDPALLKEQERLTSWFKSLTTERRRSITSIVDADWTYTVVCIRFSVLYFTVLVCRTCGFEAERGACFLCFGPYHCLPSLFSFSTFYWTRSCGSVSYYYTGVYARKAD